jgi:hypothetical protein
MPSVPIEIWDEFFSHLTYIDLLSCRKTCKALARLFDHPRHSGTTFRSDEVMKAAHISSFDGVEVHPILLKGNRKCAMWSPYAVHCLRWSTKSDFRDCKVLQEKATDPPVGLLYIKLRVDYPSIKVQRKTGVTVKNVMQAAQRMCAKHSLRELDVDITGFAGFERIDRTRTGQVVLQGNEPRRHQELLAGLDLDLWPIFSGLH